MFLAIMQPSPAHSCIRAPLASAPVPRRPVLAAEVSCASASSRVARFTPHLAYLALSCPMVVPCAGVGLLPKMFPVYLNGVGIEPSFA